VRTPLVVHWPGHTEGPGEVRPHFCHAVDLFSTVLDAAGIDPPVVVDGVTQQPIDGASIIGTMEDRSAPSPRRTQYFEMHGSRGIYHDGWKATTDYVSPLFGERLHLPGSNDIDDDHWALFNLEEDFSESHDLAAVEPARAQALQELWWAEAGRNQVLPLWEGGQSGAGIHPGEYPSPAVATYSPGGGGICEAQLPVMMGGFTATAELVVPADREAEGVVCALGDQNDGWAFYLLGGRPVTCLLSFGHATRVGGPEPVPAGLHDVSVRFRPGPAGQPNLTLLVDDVEVASAEHPAPALFVALSTAGARMLVGRDRGLPFNDDYEPPFPLSVTLRKLVMRSERPSATRIPSEVVDTASHGD
jgi:arylsulfatase